MEVGKVEASIAGTLLLCIVGALIFAGIDSLATTDHKNKVSKPILHTDVLIPAATYRVTRVSCISKESCYCYLINKDTFDEIKLGIRQCESLEKIK